MANIQIQNLYKQKKREFLGNVAITDTRFEEDFIDAVNMAIGRVNDEADLATSINQISSTEDEINLEDTQLHHISDIVSYFLVKMGNKWRTNADGASLQQLKQEADDAIGLLWYNAVNQMNHDVDQDQTNSIGNLGEW